MSSKSSNKIQKKHRQQIIKMLKNNLNPKVFQSTWDRDGVSVKK